MKIVLNIPTPKFKKLSPRMKKRVPYVLAGLVLFLVLVISLCNYFHVGLFANASPALPPEVAYLNQNPRSFAEYSTYFRELANKKGAPYAFTVLKYTNFPTNIDIHLLGHAVGDILYKQQGVEGIKVCTQDFRNACSHSVVVGMLNEHGEGALADIAKTCQAAPGGRGAYTMCFHGLGHGVLAYTGYDLEKAVTMCQKTATPEHQGREAVECVGGTIMEMIAGVHDKVEWEKQVPKYFKTSDPLYPCDAAFMPNTDRAICYTYLTPHLFTSAGMDVGNLDTKNFGKSFTLCDALPSDDLQNRAACYGGFGKEFTAYAQGRDIRDIGAMSEPALRNVRSWCAEAGNTFGEGACNNAALSSLFWGGENNPDASFTYCKIASDANTSGECYSELTDAISFYLQGNKNAATLCARLPEPFSDICRKRASL